MGGTGKGKPPAASDFSPRLLPYTVEGDDGKRICKACSIRSTTSTSGTGKVTILSELSTCNVVHHLKTHLSNRPSSNSVESFIEAAAKEPAAFSAPEGSIEAALVREVKIPPHLRVLRFLLKTGVPLRTAYGESMKELMDTETVYCADSLKKALSQLMEHREMIPPGEYTVAFDEWSALKRSVVLFVPSVVG